MYSFWFVCEQIWIDGPIILGCIQNFNCKTVTFPQVTVTQVKPGSFDSGPFNCRFVGVLNLFPTTSTKEDTATKVWEVCRSYNTLVEDFKLTSLSTETMWTNEATDDLHLVQGMAIAAVLLGSVMMIGVLTAPYYGIACLMQWKCYGK